MEGKSDKFLVFIYRGAILIGCLSLISSALYLFYYLFKSPPPDQIKLETMVSYNSERRMALISTAFSIAMSFGFIGFALFIIDAKGDLEGSAQLPTTSFKVAKMSPGIFAILCATVIIIVCAKIKIEYNVELQTPLESQAQEPTQERKEDITDTSTDAEIPAFVKKKKHDVAEKDSTNSTPNQ